MEYNFLCHQSGLLWSEDVLVYVACAGGRELEALDGEGKVNVEGVVDEEAVVDGLLHTLVIVVVSIG